MSTPARVSLSVRSCERVLASAAGLVPASRELTGLWPIVASIGDGRCVEHLPAPFLPTTEPSDHSLRPRVVGMTVRTFAARQASRELTGLWPIVASIGDGRCVEHLPAPFLPTTEPSDHSLRPRVVGMTVRTFAARQVGSAAVQAVLHDPDRSAGNRGSRGAYAPREVSAVGRSRRRRAAPLPSAPHGAKPPWAGRALKHAFPCCRNRSQATGFSTK